jgi:hypothetical protein
MPVCSVDAVVPVRVGVRMCSNLAVPMRMRSHRFYSTQLILWSAADPMTYWALIGQFDTCDTRID